jgi:hypothetical protein
MVDTSSPDPLLANGSISHPAAPFDIVIDRERMTVTACANVGDTDDGNGPPYLGECGENEGGATKIWVVTRGVGNTTVASHATGLLVMSTPLPLLPATVPTPYVGGNQALMCVADQKNLEGGGHSTTFIDIGGDGWGKVP